MATAPVWLLFYAAADLCWAPRLTNASADTPQPPRLPGNVIPRMSCSQAAGRSTETDSLGTFTPASFGKMMGLMGQI